MKKFFRGVAQLIARAVWDREVEGLSPFTPTKKKSVQMDGFFLVPVQTFNPDSLVTKFFG